MPLTCGLEDIDLDLIRPVPWGLEDQVEAALKSPALRSLLAVGGLALAEHTSTKQTETTHRWKIGIQTPGGPALVRSKVEFSNREGEDAYALASLRDAVVEPYALRPPMVQHYDAEAATMQKVAALAGRVQALPFLEPGAAELIASPGAWEQIQTFVADRLEAAR